LLQVVPYEENLSRQALARLMDCAHVYLCAKCTRVHCSITNFKSAGTDRAIWRWLAAFGPDEAYHVENHDKRGRNSRFPLFGDGR
jgi:hypothetical protein